jgi:hypothetical protein
MSLLSEQFVLRRSSRLKPALRRAFTFLTIAFLARSFSCAASSRRTILSPALPRSASLSLICSSFQNCLFVLFVSQMDPKILHHALTHSGVHLARTIITPDARYILNLQSFGRRISRLDVGLFTRGYQFACFDIDAVDFHEGLEAVVWVDIT